MSDANTPIYDPREPWQDVEYVDDHSDRFRALHATDDVLHRLAAIERRIDHLEAHAFAQHSAVEYDRVQGEYVVRGRV